MKIETMLDLNNVDVAFWDDTKFSFLSQQRDKDLLDITNYDLRKRLHNALIKQQGEVSSIFKQKNFKINISIEILDA